MSGRANIPLSRDLSTPPEMGSPLTPYFIKTRRPGIFHVLMTPDGILFEGNEIPDELQSGELISRLVNTLGLPRATTGG